MCRPLARLLVMASVLVAQPSWATPDAGREQGSSGLSVPETRRLLDGENVVRPHTTVLGQKRYVGGVAYVIVNASPDELNTAFTDVEAMREILPRTRHVERIGARGNDSWLELHQGSALVHARYTLRVRNEPERNRVRFWLDRSRPHALDDAWGFLRYERFQGQHGPATLVTYGVLFDLGDGVVRSLYEERLRAMALTVPLRLREYLVRAGRANRPAKRA